MKDEFKLLVSGGLEHAAWMDEESDQECEYKIAFGRSVIDEYDVNAWGRMAECAPNDTLLYDQVGNSFGALVISDKFKNVLAEALQPEDVEFLPYTILDHHGQAVPNVYWRVNLLNPVDCIDLEQSDLKMSRVNPESIRHVRKLVIDYSKIPESRKMFLAKGLKRQFFTHQSLIDSIEAADITNVQWDGFDNIW